VGVGGIGTVVEVGGIGVVVGVGVGVGVGGIGVGMRRGSASRWRCESASAARSELRWVFCSTAPGMRAVWTLPGHQERTPRR